MKENKKIDSLVKTALEYKNQAQFEKSNKILEKILEDFPDYLKANGIMVVVAGNYYKLNKYSKTLNYCEKILSKNPKIELASLMRYLSYVNLDDPKKAFKALFEYLEKYPADLFKDTLEELLEGLLEGYGTTYKDKIVYYAEMNNVPVPERLR